MGAARVMAGRPRRRSGKPCGPLSRTGNVDRRRGIRCSERKRRETSDSRCVLQSHNSLPLRLFFHRPDRTGRARALPGRARSSYLIHDVDEPGRARGQDFCSPGFGDLHVRGDIEAPVRRSDDQHVALFVGKRSVLERLQARCSSGCRLVHERPDATGPMARSKSWKSAE